MLSINNIINNSNSIIIISIIIPSNINLASTNTPSEYITNLVFKCIVWQKYSFMIDEAKTNEKGLRL